MVVEAINVENIFQIVSLVLFLTISRTIRILAHEKDQYSYIYKILGRILSRALKRTKAGPRSSGNPVQFYYKIIKINNKTNDSTWRKETT